MRGYFYLLKDWLINKIDWKVLEGVCLFLFPERLVTKYDWLRGNYLMGLQFVNKCVTGQNLGSRWDNLPLWYSSPNSLNPSDYENFLTYPLKFSKFQLLTPPPPPLLPNSGGGAFYQAFKINTNKDILDFTIVKLCFFIDQESLNKIRN